MERFTPQVLREVVFSPDFIRTQNNGVKAFIKQVGNKYHFIAFSEKTNEVVTDLSNIDKKALVNLAKNYGWKL